MGEYIQLDGRHYKLGTCESLYYVRYDDLAGWIRDGRVLYSPGNEQPREYLQGTPYRFRFPFPDEDDPEEETRLDRYYSGAGIDLQGQEAYTRGITFRVPRGMVDDGDIVHFPISTWVRAKGLDFVGMSFSHPCPQSHDNFRDDALGDWGYLSVVQQRPIEGRLWTVVGCAFCAGLWRLDAEGAALLAAHITTQCPKHAELARRILAGYEEGAAWVP